jgi:imidazoleglycerol phosphate synthase glutamine amidotransferase subunit HisH
MKSNAFAKHQATIPALSIGNLAAVANMVRRCGGEAVITANSKDLYQSHCVMLTCVGAFDAGMRVLEEGGWLKPLQELAQRRQIPILGICRGM